MNPHQDMIDQCMRNCLERKYNKVEKRKIDSTYWFMALVGSDGMPCVDWDDKDAEFRFAPETVIINGIEINAPLRVRPNSGDKCYVTSINPEKVIFTKWILSDNLLYLFREGFIFATKEDAQACMDAMKAPLREYMNGAK